MRGEGLGKRVGATEVPLLFKWLGWRLEVPWMFTMETKLPQPDATLLYESHGLTVDAKKVETPKYT